MAAEAIPRFGVAGDPVAHSLSPAMHTAAYAALGIAADYQRLPIPPALFEETVRALPGSGFRGINVTIPHKEAALALADEASEAARGIGAANTLTFDGRRIRADNTDAPGFVAAVPGGLAGRRVLILGAGGTARAVCWAAKGSGAEVAVVNRTHSRAAALAEEFGAASEFDGSPVDVLVNTTSVGMDGAGDPIAELDIDLASLGTPLVVDFVYRDGGTPLLKAASDAGSSTIDGHELLARQGALSFQIWFGGEPPLDAMRAALTSV